MLLGNNLILQREVMNLVRRFVDCAASPGRVDRYDARIIQCSEPLENYLYHYCYICNKCNTLLFIFSWFGFQIFVESLNEIMRLQRITLT